MDSTLQLTLRHSGANTKSGQRHCGAVRFFYALLLCLIALPAVAVELNEIARLAKGGAAQLALSLLQQEQPTFEGDSTQWLRWERMRLRILEQRRAWAELARRVDNHPAGLPEEFRRWALGRRARALILDDHPVEARRTLRQLIWLEPDEARELLPQWRQLVMQSYLRENRVEDAYVAMLRYQQDYGSDDEAALLMRARILLASDRPAEARSLLQRHRDGHTLSLLLTLARLRSGEAAADILAQLRAVDKLDDYTPLQRYLHYGVMAEAAKEATEPAFVIIALEHWYRLDPMAEEWNELFRFDIDTLWQSYHDYALRTGNREQLLLGDDRAWLEMAEKTAARYPVRKRSLYALMAIKGYAAASREQASVELVKQLQGLDNGMALVQSLFLRSGRFGPAQPVPPAVAYMLVDQAIRDGDLAQASRLLRQLPEPPEGTDRFPWQMRRIKVFILAGEYDAAVELLRALLPSAASLGKQQRDQLIQLLFDLQTVGQHESAFALLGELYRRIPNLQLRRELLFWMADSRVAQQNYIAAARLYLQSATLSDSESMDPWAQTARYKAAETLAKGGMLADAAHLYSQLLRVTESPERRAVLHHELEQVRMRQAADER